MNENHRAIGNLLKRHAVVWVFVFLAFTPLAANEANRADRPNVIFVLTDDQGYGDLSCHGNPVLKTPSLDRLHNQSIRFTNFHVSPMCTPTRGELLSGQDALRCGAYCACSGRTFMREDLPTMADVFVSAGYRTGMFGKWHLGDNHPYRPQDRGFAQAVYHLGWGITSTPDYWNNDYFDDHFRHNGKVKEYPGYCTDVWFNEATSWIKRCAEKQEPFFAYIATNAPHGPFYVPEKYRKPYKDQPHSVASFFGMIANLDENMAKLDAMLTETGLAENTILVFMTDNGGTGGIKVFNAGMRGAKASYYEGGHRVPFFLRWPGGQLRSAGSIDTLTRGQDLLPTLIDLCDLQEPAGADFPGVSLAGLLHGRKQPELSTRMQVVQYGGLVNTNPQKWEAAVLWNQWRLVHGKELYNVKTDPGQRTDLAAAQPDIVKKMRTHYEQWWTQVKPTLTQFNALSIGSEQENPTCLTSLDWLAPTLVIAAQPFDVRLLGKTKVVEGSLPLGRPQPTLNSPWYVNVRQDGEYEISLRRWPVEADAAIAAPLPPYQGVDGSFPEGLALPAVRARLKIGDVDVSKPIGPKDRAATFRVELTAGKTHLQTWFQDAAGKELCGAFYVYVRRTSNTKEGVATNPFFALCHDTHDAKKRSLDEQAALLKELGYDGAGHLWLKNVAERLKTLDAARLKLFQIYMRLNLAKGVPYDPQLKEILPLLAGRGAMLAILIQGRSRTDQTADLKAVDVLREIADMADRHGVRVAIYHHAGDFTERPEDAVRIAKKVDRKNVGVMFNLCHWLKTGKQQKMKPLLKTAAPHLMAVSINGTDTAAEIQSGKGQWLQPLDSGSFDMIAFLRALKETGYKGPIGLQCYGIGGDARNHLTRSMAAWRGFLKELDEQ
ncbi:MAG: sulfatase-like hydrolase/transferase [Fuerstiella sp.]|nr:sulfatase-like hydrolase/transferase [Fuerstiella sp.]MCP4853797.1 sulfatase-like hydrolase/transferase [Fuerstiella sp.]